MTMRHANADGYALSTGPGAAIRLQLLDQIFGPTTRELLFDVGLERAVRVADIGCGTGLVATWIGERLRERGSVTGVDASAEQLAVARSIVADRALDNVVFRVADAYETGLEEEQFDIVYSRFLMCHLTRPRDALIEMLALVKPGGTLVCEDYEAKSVATDPLTDAYRRLREISAALDRAPWCRLGDWTEIAPSVHRPCHR
jgi:ubiquinone/menaquinone biosynthesis C-methylase UbiE